MRVRRLNLKISICGLVLLLIALAPGFAVAQTAANPLPAVNPDRAGESVDRAPNDKKADVLRQPDSTDFDELRENIRNTMELVFKIKREIDAIQQKGAGVQITELMRRTQEIENKISALEQRVSAKFGKPEILLTPSKESEPVLPRQLPPAPKEPAGDQPWLIEVDASGRPRLVSKREAESWPRAIAPRDQCATVGAWVEEQRTRLVKDGFFVRDNTGIALCRRSQDGEWRVYSGNAGTDRFHIVVSSGS